MALLQSIEDRQFAANVKMLRQAMEEVLQEQKKTNALLSALLEMKTNQNS